MEKEELDQEWVQLIMEARNMGIQKEAISLFLNEAVTTNELVETTVERKIDE